MYKHNLHYAFMFINNVWICQYNSSSATNLPIEYDDCLLQIKIFLNSNFKWRINVKLKIA
jgi:hypothetical protein